MYYLVIIIDKRCIEGQSIDKREFECIKSCKVQLIVTMGQNSTGLVGIRYSNLFHLFFYVAYLGIFSLW